MKNKILLLIMCLIGITLLSACEKQIYFNDENYTYMEESSSDNSQLYKMMKPPYTEIKVEKQPKEVIVTYDSNEYKIHGNKDNSHITLPDGRFIIVSFKYDGTYTTKQSNLDMDKDMDIIFGMGDTPISDIGKLIYDLKKPWTFHTKNFFIGLFLSIIGFFAVKNPGKLWRASEGWKYKNVEPSDGYLILQQVLGFIFGCIGVILIITSFI